MPAQSIKSHWLGYFCWVILFSVQNAATQFAGYWRVLSGIYACKLVDFGARFSLSLKDSSSASYAISYLPLIFSVRNTTCLSLSPLDTPSSRTGGKDAQRRMRRKGEKSYLWGSISCFLCSLEDTHTNKYKQLDMFLYEEPCCNTAKKITQFQPSNLLTSSACSII